MSEDYLFDMFFGRESMEKLCPTRGRGFDWEVVLREYAVGLRRWYDWHRQAISDDLEYDNFPFSGEVRANYFDLIHLSRQVGIREIICAFLGEPAGGGSPTGLYCWATLQFYLLAYVDLLMPGVDYSSGLGWDAVIETNDLFLRTAAIVAALRGTNEAQRQRAVERLSNFRKPEVQVFGKLFDDRGLAGPETVREMKISGWEAMREIAVRDFRAYPAEPAFCTTHADARHALDVIICWCVEHPSFQNDAHRVAEILELHGPLAQVPKRAGDGVLSALQRGILEELDGKAMSKSELAHALDIDGSVLYRPGGINELKETGRVKNDRLVGGYYRPDRPPTVN